LHGETAWREAERLFPHGADRASNASGYRETEAAHEGAEREPRLFVCSLLLRAVRRRLAIMLTVAVITTMATIMGRLPDTAAGISSMALPSAYPLLAHMRST
jgi:hypothetical protein